MHRFFINENDIHNNSSVLEGRNAIHAGVLRIKIGEHIVLCNENSIDHTAIVKNIEKGRLYTEIISSSANLAEPGINITIFQALPKGDKFEEIINNCVQLGVIKIVPIITSRCITRLSGRDDKKLMRWQDIAEAAAKQSGRGRIPVINEIMSFNDAVTLSKKSELCFACYELEENQNLKEIFNNSKPQSISFFIGSEGGFTFEEVQTFIDNNIKTVSLGKRILRTELAGAFVMSCLIHQFEE